MFAAQTGLGSIRATRVIRDVLVANTEVRRGAASNCTRELARRAKVQRRLLRSPLIGPSCHSAEKSAYICLICGSNPEFKIKELSQKGKNRSSNPIKGFLPKKIRNFFIRLFYQNTGQILQKPPKKPCKITQKTREF